MTSRQGHTITTHITRARLQLAALEERIAQEDWTALDLLQPLQQAQASLDTFLRAMEDRQQLVELEAKRSHA